MGWPDRREVPAVERRHLWLAEALAGRNDRCVDQAELEGGVGALEARRPEEHRLIQRLKPVRTALHVLHENFPRLHAVEAHQPVVDFDQDGYRYDEVL